MSYIKTIFSAYFAILLYGVCITTTFVILAVCVPFMPKVADAWLLAFGKAIGQFQNEMNSKKKEGEVGNE